MSIKYEDYYKVLGVSRSASQDEIQKGFRKLARKYHPDVSKEPDAEENFKRINEAYEVLKNPESRKRYDALGANWKAGQDFRPPPGWGGQAGGVRFEDLFGGQAGGFSDFFKIFMGQGGAPGAGFGGPGGFGGAGFGPQPGGFGGGAGFDPRAGAGRQGARKAPGKTVEISVPLSVAYHGGKQSVNLRQANGQPKSYTVKIPAGITSGQTIRLAGQVPAQMPGQAAGDLLLKIQLEAHPIFDVEGQNLSVTLDVTPWEAALGASVSAPTFESPVRLKIPAGVVSGAKMRLKGKGLAGKGDLFVVIRIVNPPSLSERERELYEELARVSSFEPRRGQ